MSVLDKPCVAAESDTTATQGFLLTRQWRDTSEGVCLELWLASETGPLQLIIPQQEAVCFVLRRQREKITALLKASAKLRSARIAEVPLKNYSGLAVDAVYCRRQRDLYLLRDTLTAQNIVHWEADIRPPERYLMERFLTASMRVHSPPTMTLPSTSSSAVSAYQTIISPRLEPSDCRPALRVASIDIETNMYTNQVLSIGVWSATDKRVFMVGADNTLQQGYQQEGSLNEWYLQPCLHEKDCIQQFMGWVALADPDVLIGWNVVGFDAWVLQQRCDRLGIAFIIGRGQQTGYWRQDEVSQRRYVVVPGRVIIDGIDALKTAFYQFPSFSLQHVAGSLLGQGKLLSGAHRGDDIIDLFNNNKLKLARYNLKDCELVWDIFEKTQLLSFLMARSQLTGLLLDRVGGSTASFEFAYLPRLHRRGYVAPNLGEVQSDIVSPGGYVMNSSPGLYDNVLVLDFKSLYPSIIRTFRVDPYAYWCAQQQKLSGSHVVPGFNGAVFAKHDHILPDIIADLWQERDEAKKNSDQALSQAIKIIMNSFYGVLGSTGCRFFDPRVCSSITLRGHDIIQTTKRWIEEKKQGYQVIYGDTDSVFVWLDRECSLAEAQTIGQELSQQLNHQWQDYIQQQFGVVSELELEFETHYRRFLMPTIRNSEEGSKKRYAGLIVTESDEGNVERIIFKGLETARSDWTDLAKNFQKALYKKIFDGDAVDDFIREQVRAVLKGEKNEQLVYRKRLRRHVVDYVRNVPPQVQAAKKAVAKGKSIQRGDWVEYVMTVHGPEPLEFLCSAIDYPLYVERQMKPVADGILQFVNERFDVIVNRQISLF